MSRTMAERAALVRDDEICQRCRRGVTGQQASLHHRKLRRAVDADTVQNLVLLCGSGTTGCHGWAHHNRAAAADTGWVVSQHADPSEIPMITVGGLWRIELHPDGTKTETRRDPIWSRHHREQD